MHFARSLKSLMLILFAVGSFILSGLCFIAAFLIFEQAESAIHEGVAAMMLVASACWAVAALVVALMENLESKIAGAAEEIAKVSALQVRANTIAEETKAELETLAADAQWFKEVKTKEILRAKAAAKQAAHDRQKK